MTGENIWIYQQKQKLEKAFKKEMIELSYM